MPLYLRSPKQTVLIVFPLNKHLHILIVFHLHYSDKNRKLKLKRRETIIPNPESNLLICRVIFNPKLKIVYVNRSSFAVASLSQPMKT